MNAYKENFPAVADAAYAKGLRMKFSGSTVTVAGATDEDIGVLFERTLISQNYRCTIIPRQTDDVPYMVASKAIAAYTKVYAAAAGKISDSGTIVVGYTLSEAATGDGALVPVVRVPALSARSGLTTDAATAYNIPLSRMGLSTTLAMLGASAGAGYFGMTPGTFGSAAPKLIGEAASGNTKTDTCRFLFALPAEYVAAGTITVRVKARMNNTLTVGGSIDVTGCYKTDGAAGIGSDLCTTTLQALTTSFANYDFTITPTGLAAGDLLDIQLTGIATDTGGATGYLIEIGAVEILLDVKG